MSDGSDESDEEEPTAVTPSHDNRITEAIVSTNTSRSASYSSLSGTPAPTTTHGRRSIDSAADDRRASSGLSRRHGNVNTASTDDGKLERHTMRHGFDLGLSSPHDDAGEEEPDQDGAIQHAPASAGVVHDIFAEYEKRFGTGGKQRCPLKSSEIPALRTGSARYDLLDEQSRESVGDEEANGDVGDGLLIGSPTEVASDELYADYAASAPTNDDGFEPLREIESRRKSTVDTLGSDGLSQGEFQATLLSVILVLPNVHTTDPTATYEVLSRKSNNNVPSAVLLAPFAASYSYIRPWKAREARQDKEAKVAFASSHPCKRRRSAYAYPVEDIENVYISEGGSIQCMVRWKPSLVATDNLVGEELHRRCELLFKEKYGSQEWEMRSKT